MKFAEIPGKLHTLLMPPDPIVINHVITVEGPDARKTACYDIDVEIVRTQNTLPHQRIKFAHIGISLVDLCSIVWAQCHLNVLFCVQLHVSDLQDFLF